MPSQTLPQRNRSSVSLILRTTSIFASFKNKKQTKKKPAHGGLELNITLPLTSSALELQTSPCLEERDQQFMFSRWLLSKVVKKH